jgi:23S rRNA pseudouridine2604 synthase
MCQTLGVRVVALHRIRIMHLGLAGLPSGAWKPLTPGEKKALFNAVQGHAREE